MYIYTIYISEIKFMSSAPFVTRVGASGVVNPSCAPTVHVAWIGTDARGRPMRSGGKVFSRYRAYNVQATVETVYGSVAATFGSTATGSRSADILVAESGEGEDVRGQRRGDAEIADSERRRTLSDHRF